MDNASNTIPASPTKLRSGDWGATVKSEKVAVGASITITTRAGKSWTAMVTKVVWVGNGVTICATESVPRSTAAPRCSRTASRTAQCPAPIYSAPRTPRRAPKSWSPCGYPGCTPHLCDDCDGAGS